MIEQVGGDHYTAMYQHWDWASDIRIGYLDGTATKYLVRWKDKGGIQDLEKALSYVKKLRSVCKQQDLTANRDLSAVFLATVRLSDAYMLSTEERTIIYKLATWQTERDLIVVSDMLTEFIARQKL